MTAQPLAIARLRCDQEDAPARLAALREKLSPQGDIVSEAGRRITLEVFGEALAPTQVVQKICHDVQTEGLEAVLRYSSKIDRADLTAETLRVSEEELQEAHASVDPAFLETIRQIRDNVHRFQSGILHQNTRLELPGGGYLAERYRPLKRVGIVVPGGAAAYPSTVLMTAVPAQAAGVEELAIVAPPTKFGSYNKDLLATCCELGIKEVYRLGGAQGVATLAYGVEGIAPVQKIVGPGNLFVALAKQKVFGTVDIDSIAGPSEVVVVAGETVPPAYIAADLIAQAEHSPGSAVFITWHEPLWEAVSTHLANQLAATDRGDLAKASLEEFGMLILARDEEEAAAIANDFAPEHLHIMTQDPEATLDKIPNAGAAFLGEFSPVAVGDYIAGPSHVLPTGGTARFAHGLNANDFLRPHSVIAYQPQDLLASAPHVERIARKEGLIAHWESVEVRLQKAQCQLPLPPDTELPE
ncbi:Histidinol dehydrogenase [Planctomycetales bacterium 10988]|nr:Histidinol dehydrogenase [Planctomycetales bacterium 10988]